MKWLGEKTLSHFLAESCIAKSLKLCALCRHTNVEKHDIIIIVRNKEVKIMSKKKGNKKSENSPIEKLVLATTIINLINTIVNLIKDLLD